MERGRGGRGRNQAVKAWKLDTQKLSANTNDEQQMENLTLKGDCKIYTCPFQNKIRNRILILSPTFGHYYPVSSLGCKSALHCGSPSSVPGQYSQYPIFLCGEDGYAEGKDGQHNSHTPQQSEVSTTVFHNFWHGAAIWSKTNAGIAGHHHPQTGPFCTYAPFSVLLPFFKCTLAVVFCYR